MVEEGGFETKLRADGTTGTKRSKANGGERRSWLKVERSAKEAVCVSPESSEARANVGRTESLAG